MVSRNKLADDARKVEHLKYHCSKLVMKQKRTGRNSVHCIPKFSQVLPSKPMSAAQKALQDKIRSKHQSPSTSSTDQEPILNDSTGSELTIEPTSRVMKRDKHVKVVPDLTIIPKYPHLTQIKSDNEEESRLSGTTGNKSGLHFVLSKDDFEKISQSNPIFYSSYVLLPGPNIFVHPLLVTPQILSTINHKK